MNISIQTKQINLTKFLKFGLTVLIFITIIIACKKSFNTDTDNTFNADAAKEWYYGTFKKSAEFLTSSEKGKKLPDWKKSAYRKIGNIEIIEFPLMKQHTKLTISKKGLSIVDLQRVANASLARIAFIKKPNGEIVIREIDYVPELQYLKTNSYDISNMNLGDINQKFCGNISIKNWNGKLINKLQLFDGKNAHKPTSSQQSSAPVGGLPQPEIGLLEYLPNCEYERFCEVEHIGDSWIYTGYCTDWQPTGNCTPDDNNNDCDLTSNVSCECQLYGLGYDNNPPQSPNPEEDCSIKGPQALNDLINSSTTSDESISITLENESSDIRTQKYNWRILKNVGWYIYSFEVGEHETTGNTEPTLKWKWKSFQHKAIKMVGTVVGGTVEYAEISAVPTVGIYNAGMDVDFSVKYSVACKGSPFANEAVYNSKKTYNVNDR